MHVDQDQGKKKGWNLHLKGPQFFFPLSPSLSLSLCVYADNWLKACTLYIYIQRASSHTHALYLGCITITKDSLGHLATLVYICQITSFSFDARYKCQSFLFVLRETTPRGLDGPSRKYWHYVVPIKSYEKPKQIYFVFDCQIAPILKL